MTTIINSNIVTAFGPKAIGTRVVDKSAFLKALRPAIEATDFSAQRVPGQAFITLDKAAIATVSAGAGKRTENPDDYVTRLYRGKVKAYLKREFAAEVACVAAVVYEIAAYLADPDVAGDAAEVARVASPLGPFAAASLLAETGALPTHVLVCVLAFAGPKSPLPTGTFVHNLAGGNKEALDYSADEIRSMAAEIEGYWNEWCVVAD